MDEHAKWLKKIQEAAAQGRLFAPVQTYFETSAPDATQRPATDTTSKTPNSASLNYRKIYEEIAKAMQTHSETSAPDTKQNPYISQSSALYDTQTPDASDGGDEKPHWVFRFEE